MGEEGHTDRNRVGGGGPRGNDGGRGTHRQKQTQIYSLKTSHVK